MSDGLRCTLPGGLLAEGGLRREAQLKPVSATLELLLADCTLEPGAWPVFVSRALGEAVASLDGEPFDPAWADALCVADRHFLMLRLAELIDGDQFWISADCRGCGERFDLRLSRSALPLKPAGSGFPFVDVPLAGRNCRFRLPTGADQIRLLDEAHDDPIAALLDACLVQIEGDPVPATEPRHWDVDAVAQVDSRMDAVAPDVGRRVQTVCPACHATQVVEFGLFGFDAIANGQIFEEIRRLAHHCHWSEADILRLPRARRRHYLRLVDAAQGWMT